MKGGLKVSFLASLVVLMAAVTASASGFGIYEWSARGNAMGGAVAANPKDASAIAYNPAGMTELEGNNMMLGASAINPYADMDFEGYEGSTAKSNVWIPPHLYMTNQLTDKWWVGIGSFSRFGLGTEWEETWAGRYNVTEASIQTLSVNPNLAYKLNDKWSFAVGGELMWMEFLQRKVVDHDSAANAFNGGKNNPNTYNTDTDAKLLGDSVGLGLTLSMFHKPLDWLSVGLTYRSQIKHKIQGDAYFARIGSQPGAVSQYSQNTTASGIIILPDSVTVAVAVKPMDKLTLEADLIWTRWSTYQELRIDYGIPLVPAAPTISDHSTSNKNWRDTWRYALGAEYALTDMVDLRAGYIYDQSPISDDGADYMLPTSDRQLYSTGLGFHWDNWVVDVSYIYLTSQEREYVDSHTSDGVLAGTSKGMVTHIGGLSLGYTF